jgi:hypothetical protein
MWIVSFLKALPTIVSFIFEVKKWVDQYHFDKERELKLKKFTEAMSNARQKKDYKDVEDLFRSIGN